MMTIGAFLAILVGAVIVGAVVMAVMALSRGGPDGGHPAANGDHGSRWGTFLTYALIMVGVLLTAGPGLCTIAIAFDSGGRILDWTVLEVALVIAGPPVAIGALLLWWGLRRRKRRKAPMPLSSEN